MKKLIGTSSIFIVIVIFAISCNKIDSTSNLYVPTASDTTATASLSDLQQGRALYVNNCGACHSLYSPDAYNASQWSSIMSRMAPNTSMSPSQVELVKKYVSRGKL